VAFIATNSLFHESKRKNSLLPADGANTLLSLSAKQRQNNNGQLSKQLNITVDRSYYLSRLEKEIIISWR